MSDLNQVEQHLSARSAQLIHAALLIGRVLAARAARTQQEAARTSLEEAKALRALTRQQRALAAPLYRQAGTKGWWTDKRISDEQRARIIGLAQRFALIDPTARTLVDLAQHKLEESERAQEKTHTREHERAGKHEIPAVSVSALAAAGALPLLDGEEATSLSQSWEDIVREAHADATYYHGAPAFERLQHARLATAPTPAPAHPMAAVQILATTPTTPASLHTLAPVGDTNAPAAWDTRTARQQWARHLINEGVDSEGVNAFMVASHAQGRPTRTLNTQAATFSHTPTPALTVVQENTLHR